jgi:hypothetical protein
MNTPARGQTLVMFALSALLLTLMVMMTISIGSKAKEKMEVQTLADAAAYSNAVATARTFNAISVMNRVQVAHMVGVTAVNSLISWSTYYFGSLFVARGHYQDWTDQFKGFLQNRPMGCCSWGGGFPCKKGCCDGGWCGCATVGYASNLAITATLNLEWLKYLMLLRALDAQAALEAMAYRDSADYVYYFGQLPALYFLYDYLDKQSGAKKLVAQAQGGNPFGGELSAQNWPDGVNMKELKMGAVLPVNPIYAHHAFAAMGSRLHPFITGRGGAAVPLINGKFLTLIPPFKASSVQVGLGSGYLTMPPFEQHGSNPFLTYFTRLVSADDHSVGPLVSEYHEPGAMLCPYEPSREGHVKSMVNSGTSIGLHTATGMVPDNFHQLPANMRMYPLFVDYNPFSGFDEGNVWNQPKNFGVVQRDYSVRQKALWNPVIKFNFSGGADSTYDNRALNLKDGTFIGRQMALATGITYYHRGNNILGYNSQVEAPNFFNPFWRAGLTRVNVDDVGLGSGDVENALGSYPAAVDSFQGLKSNGFKGWQ